VYGASRLDDRVDIDLALFGSSRPGSGFLAGALRTALAKSRCASFCRWWLSGSVSAKSPIVVKMFALSMGQ
jgi:hypothetical protein